MKRLYFLNAVAALVVVFLATSFASAQATRTWVSGVGDDVNPCSRTAPCKTFAGAISKTAAGGEINAIDPGGFGAVTITKAITIDGEGTLASILASATTGIIVNCTGTNANAVVTLRNLDINGAGITPGNFGIRFLGGKALHIENCRIYGFGLRGIDCSPNSVTPNTTSTLFVKDTIIRNNLASPAGATNGAGITLAPGGTTSVNATLDNVRLEGNSFGLLALDRTKIAASNSVVAGNVTQGFIAATGAAGPIAINLESCLVANNGGVGIQNQSTNPNAIIRLSNVTVVGNSTGLSAAAGGGGIKSFLNNRIDGNTTDGAPTSTKAQQ